MRFATRWIAHLPIPGAPARSIDLAGLVPLPLAGATLCVDAAAATSDPASGSAPAGWSCLVGLPGKARTGAALPAATTATELDDALHIWTRLAVDGGAFSIESDFLGLMPVYCVDAADGVLLSNRLDLLKAVEPAIAAGPRDRVGMIEYFVLLTPMGERTLYARVRRLGQGSRLRWSAHDGLTVSVTQPFVANQPDAGRSTPDVLQAMDEALSDSVTRKLRHATTPVLAAFSGGFDSRLVGGLLKRAGVDARLFSQGGDHHDEIRRARAIARRLGFPWQRVDYPDNYLERHRAQYLDLLEAQCDPFILHTAQLARLDFPAGTSIANGFMGDAAAGMYLDKLGDEPFRSRDALVEGLIGRFAWPTLPRFFQAIGWNDWRDTLAQAIHETLLPAPHLYQTAMLWNYTCRQRRMISLQAWPLGSRFAPLLLFVDRAYMALMLDQPLVALQGRALFRQYLLRYFPDLAEVPHPVEPFAINPKLREMLGRALAELPSNLVRRLPGGEACRQWWWRLNGHAHRDVQRMSYGGETPALRAAQAAMVQSQAGAFERLCGLALPAGLLDLCFPDEHISHEGLCLLARTWGLAAGLAADEAGA